MVDTAAHIYRDYNVDGDPGSGAHKPVKSEIREWGADVETRLTDAEADISAIPGTVAAGYLALSGGTLTGLLTTNGQIKFPATQNPSADANTLDDYEEGTFTPIFSATGCTFSYSSQIGHYTKIGNRVTAEIRIVLNSSGNTLAANNLSIAGLPFSNGSSVSVPAFINWFATTASYIMVGALMGAGSSSMNIVGMTAAGTNATGILLATNGLHATNGTIYNLTITYHV